MKINVTVNGKPRNPPITHPDVLAQVILACCGGGQTEAQTIWAMRQQGHLLDRVGNVVIFHNVTFPSGVVADIRLENLE